MSSKIGLFRLFVFLVCAVLFAAASAREGRPLDDSWRFARADIANAETIEFDDSGWQTVSLPHSFNAQDGDEHDYRGPAWYRRHVMLKPMHGRRVFLEFGAATLVADVYVNGQPVGQHRGGFASFRFDVTTILKPGDNLIAVRVDNSLDKTVAPIGGDFTVFGGLIRPAKLILTGPTHIDLLDSGGPGLYASAADIGADAAIIAIDARLANDDATPTEEMLRLDIRDARGHIVARTQIPVTLAGHEIKTVRHSMSVPHPHLWDGVRDPYLYRVTARIAGDTLAVPLGIRQFRVDPNEGFVLNGKPYDLYGVNYFHAQRPGKGTAVSDREIDEDFRIMGELGVHGLRLAHFQHPQRAYDDADRDGFVLWTEIPLNTEFDASPAFLENIRQQMRELVVQNFNHPSVAIWGLGNELRISDEASNRLLAAAQQTAESLDPNRLTAYAHCCLADDDPLTTHADLLGFNRYWGLYEGPDTLDDIGPWADKMHAATNRPFGISEYGGCAAISQQEDPPSRPKPKSHWHPEQYQTIFHQAYWTQFKSRPYLWEKFVWQMFESAVASRRDGATPGLNDKGLVTYDRKVKKDAFFWYKAYWSKTPFVYITSRRFSPRKSARVDVKVFTNLNAVTLWLNGRRIGTQPVDGRVALWRDVELEPGDNMVTVRGRRGDTGFSDHVVWRLTP